MLEFIIILSIVLYYTNGDEKSDRIQGEILSKRDNFKIK